MKNMNKKHTFNGLIIDSVLFTIFFILIFGLVFPVALGLIDTLWPDEDNTTSGGIHSRKELISKTIKPCIIHVSTEEKSIEFVTDGNCKYVFINDVATFPNKDSNGS